MPTFHWGKREQSSFFFKGYDLELHKPLWPLCGKGHWDVEPLVWVVMCPVKTQGLL